MRNIRKFFASIRQWLFAARVEREIYHKVFPQINGQANHGYPFGSKDEMVRQYVCGNLTVHGTLRLIERAAGKMPRAEGDAFRYIAYATSMSGWKCISNSPSSASIPKIATRVSSQPTHNSEAQQKPRLQERGFIRHNVSRTRAFTIACRFARSNPRTAHSFE